MATHQNNTLLKAAQSNAANKAFKRVLFSPPKNTPFLFLQIYFCHRTGSLHNLAVSASNLNRIGQCGCGLDTTQLWTGRRASANMGLASCGVKCLNSSAVFQFNFSAGLTVLCPEIPHERQAQNRYRSIF
jgi:hypothetical protein